MIISEGTEQAYNRIVEAAERLSPLFLGEERKNVQGAVESLKRKILPLIRKECPLLVAVAGGGSVGKSTLFNYLAGGAFSGVKSRAGYTRRTLAAINPAVAANEDRMAVLFELFRKNAKPTMWESPDQVLQPGDPLYVTSDRISERYVVLDTPDFDTGTREEFANRESAEEILAASDVLVYLFTNQTYNNKANSDFVRNAVAGVGRRKVVLVYRCSVAFAEEEVEDHMGVVLRNLFPDSADPRSEALGLYRMDESDGVVRGEAPPNIRAVAGGQGFKQLLEGLDVAEVRKDTLRTLRHDVMEVMRGAVEKASVRRDEIVVYRDAVRTLASISVRNSLNQFPQAELMQEFVKYWRAAQPTWVRMVHWGGRTLSSGVKKIRDKLLSRSGKPDTPTPKSYAETFRGDFVDCMDKLRSRLQQPRLDFEVSLSRENTRDFANAIRRLHGIDCDRYGFCERGKCMAECSIARPTALKDAIEAKLGEIRVSSEDEWVMQAVEAASCNNLLVKDMQELVAQARRRMTAGDKIKEGAFAVVSALPAIGTVTWIAMTADPVVGTGVMASLNALFGIGDACVGLVLAPATSLGIDAANRRYIKQVLEDLYKTWFVAKCGPIHALVDEHLTSCCTRLCDGVLGETEAPLDRLRDAVETACAGEEEMS